MHTLFNCASWVGHQSTIWSLGGIKPSCNTPQGHNTSYTQPAPLAHTAIPLIQLFLIFKTQKHNSYFFFIVWPWGSHTPKVPQDKGARPSGARTPKSCLAEDTTQKRQTANSKLWINKLTPNQTKMQMCQSGTSQSLLTGLSESPSHFPRCPQSPWWSLLHPWACPAMHHRLLYQTMQHSLKTEPHKDKERHLSSKVHVFS